MRKTTHMVIEDIIDEIKELKPEGLKEVLDFILFLKVKQTIDPSQAYFWTRAWQQWEREADEDKKADRVIGDGTAEGLLKALKT